MVAFIGQCEIEEFVDGIVGIWAQTRQDAPPPATRAQQFGEQFKWRREVDLCQQLG